MTRVLKDTKYTWAVSNPFYIYTYTYIEDRTSHLKEGLSIWKEVGTSCRLLWCMRIVVCSYNPDRWQLVAQAWKSEDCDCLNPNYSNCISQLFRANLRKSPNQCYLSFLGRGKNNVLHKDKAAINKQKTGRIFQFESNIYWILISSL